MSIEIGRSAVVFAALGDATRLSLLQTLSDGEPRAIAELSAGMDMTRQAVTKHLQVLENATLVECTRIGRESRYVFRPDRLSELHAYLDGISNQWDGAIGRLRILVEKEID